MEKVAEFYARWFAKKRAPDYWDAEAASEEFANDVLGVHESNKRDFSQSCCVKFLRGTIVNLNSQAHLQGEEQMTLSEVIAFFEAQSKELCPWRAKESIERAYD
jgi:hypothetical protein